MIKMTIEDYLLLGVVIVIIALLMIASIASVAKDAIGRNKDPYIENSNHADNELDEFLRHRK